jgi:hypothetical protein
MQWTLKSSLLVIYSQLIYQLPTPETFSILCCDCHLSRCHIFSVIFAELNSWLTAHLELQNSIEHFFISTLLGQKRKYRFQQYRCCCVLTYLLLRDGFFYCCVHIRCCGNVFTEPLPSNGRLFWLHYSDFQPLYHNIWHQQVCCSSLCTDMEN